MYKYNFKFIKQSKTEPTNKIYYQILDGYTTYIQPKKNPLSYIIYDPVNEVYHSFEHNGVSKDTGDILRDLINTIRNVIKEPVRYR